MAIDVSGDKLEQARAFGATDTIDAADEDTAARALALTDGRGFDVAMTAVGNARAIEQALPLLARDGALVVVGMPPYDERVSLDATTLSHFGQRILGCKMGDARLRVDAPRLFRLYRSAGSSWMSWSHRADRWPRSTRRSRTRGAPRVCAMSSSFRADHASTTASTSR